jgi:hypothetical protein
MTTDQPENSQKNPEIALTCIRNAYTLADTPDSVNDLMIKNFLNTLAEIALSIATRESSDK